MIKQAVILAAGEGRRLRPFTVNRPKSMISIAGKPTLAYIVEALARNGIRDIVLVVGYKREQVYNYMGDGSEFGVNLTFVTQRNQLSAAHGLLQAKDVVDDEFMVLSGDKLIDARTIAGYLDTVSPSMLLKQINSTDRYGMVTVEGGIVTGVQLKNTRPSTGLVCTGIYSFTREIFDYIEPESNIFETINRMIWDGKRIVACETEGVWLDVVYPWDIVALNGAILRKVDAVTQGTLERGVYIKGAVAIGKNTLIKSNSCIEGPAVIGDGCIIGPNTVIKSYTTISDNVRIDSFSEVGNSLIADDVYIGTGSIIQDSVVDKGCIVQGRLTACTGEAEIKVKDEHHSVKVGMMMGEGCLVGSSVTVEPGAIIGNYSKIKPLKLVSGRIPDEGLVV